MNTGSPIAHAYRSILVAIDSSPQAQQALTDAVDLVLAHNARLSVMVVVPKPAVVVLGYGAPVYAEDPWERIERECCQLLDRSVDGLPAQLPVTKISSTEHRLARSWTKRGPTVTT